MRNDLKNDLKLMLVDVGPYFLALLAALVVLIFLLDRAWSADICLPPETAGLVVVELEQCRIQKDELLICNEAVNNLEQTVTTYSDEVDVCKGSLTDARAAFADNKKLQEEQKLNYEAQLKIAQPSFFQRLINNAALIGGGIVAGIVAGILLGR